MARARARVRARGGPRADASGGPPAPPLDLALVVAERNRGWVLETICQQVAARAAGPTALHFDPGDGGPLPAAGCYFFSHLSLYLAHLDELERRAARSLVCFTHPTYPRSKAASVARALDRATHVVVLASAHREALVADGVDPSRVSTVAPGADPERFRPHRRGSGAVGFCSAFYPRKGPETVAGLVAALPGRRFVLLGRGWEQWDGFAALAGLANFEYRQSAYERYPDFYDEIDVFVSPSRLEGGPVPLLEAMMANAVPVATTTGFAPDLIDHGVNGFLCDVGAPVERFAELVEAAYDLSPEVDVRATVAHRTWDRFARTVLSLGAVDASPAR